MSWKRGQTGGFPGLLPARWELFLPRRKARGVILGKRPSSAPDRLGIQIVPYMGRSPGESNKLSHMWDNPLAEGPRSYARKASPLYAGQVGNPDCPIYGTIPPGRGAADCPICGTIPLAEGPRSYARKASPLYAGQVGNPDCPIYGTIPRGEQQTVPYVGQSPCRRAEELCSESIPPLRRTGRESGLSRIWDDPPGRATNCPICGTIPLAEGPRSYARKASPLYAGQVGNPDCPVYGTIPPGRGAADCPICGTIPLPKGRGVMLGKHPPSTPDRSGIRIVPYMGRSPGESNKLSHMWDNPLAEGPRSYARKASPLYAGQVGNPDCPIYGTIPRGEQQTVPYVGQSPLPKGRGVMLGKHPPSTPDRSGIRIVPYMGRSPGESNKLSHMWDNPLAEGPRSYARKASPLYAGQVGNPDCPVYGTIPPGRGAADCPICGTIPLPKGRGVMLGKHPPSTPDRSGIRIVPYMGRSPPAGEPRTVPYVGQSPLPKGRGVMLGKHPPSTPDRSGIRIVPYMGRSPGESNKLSHMWDNPLAEGPRSYARKALLLCARQFGNPDCPIYGTIPRGEQQTVPYVGQSPCRRAEELCSESIPPLRRTGRESGLSRIWDDPPGRATNCPICGTIPLPKGRNVPYGGTISIVEKSERSAVQTPFCNTSPFISPRRVKLMTGCFLLHRPMARRPGDARSAARGISTGVISRGTPGRAFQGGQPVRVGLGLQTVRLGFRRSRAAHRCSPPVSSATTPIPHALPMRFPGRVSGEGLEKPRPDRDGSPGWPGGWNAEVSSGRIPWARLVRLRGEDPRGKPGMGLGRPRGKAPGSTWGEEGNGSRKPGERGARSDGSRRRWPTPTASIRRLQTRKGFPQGFPASGRNPSTPNFLAPKNRSDFLATRNSAGKPGENPANGPEAGRAGTPRGSREKTARDLQKGP
jgi:hypothetical protein